MGQEGATCYSSDLGWGKKLRGLLVDYFTNITNCLHVGVTKSNFNDMDFGYCEQICNYIKSIYKKPKCDYIQREKHEIGCGDM